MIRILLIPVGLVALLVGALAWSGGGAQRRADFAFIKGWKGDEVGNVVYRKTARNFHPMMAAAAEKTFAEVEELVKPGKLDPEAIATPGVFVDVIFQGGTYEKRIEKRVHR